MPVSSLPKAITGLQYRATVVKQLKDVTCNVLNALIFFLHRSVTSTSSAKATVMPNRFSVNAITGAQIVDLYLPHFQSDVKVNRSNPRLLLYSQCLRDLVVYPVQVNGNKVFSVKAINIGENKNCLNLRL